MVTSVRLTRYIRMKKIYTKRIRIVLVSREELK
jgi:hypothetical protein